MTRNARTAGMQLKDLKEDDLEQARGGVAPLKPAEFVTGKPRQNLGFFVPEVDDEVIV